MDIGGPRYPGGLRYQGGPGHSLLEPLFGVVGNVVGATNRWLIVVALLSNSKSKTTIWNLNPEANSSMMLVFFRLYGRGMSFDKAKDIVTDVLIEVNLVKMSFLSHLR